MKFKLLLCRSLSTLLIMTSLSPAVHPVSGHEDPIEDLANMNFGFVRKLEYVAYSKVSVHTPAFQQSSLSGSKQTLNRKTVPASDDSFLLEMDAYNKTFCMHLHPNYELIHPDATFISHITSKYSRDIKRKLEAKAYRGFVVSVADHKLGDEPVPCDQFHSESPFENYGETHGWVRLVLSERTFQSHNLRRRSEQPTQSPEFEGAFMADGVMYIIKTIKRYRLTRRNLDAKLPTAGDVGEEHRNSRMIIYRHQDIRLPDDASDELRHNYTTHHFCGSDTLKWNTDQKDGAAHFQQQRLKAWQKLQSSVVGVTPVQSNNMLVKRASIPTGCPSIQKILYMGVALDCSYIRYHGSEEAAREQTINNFNVVSGIYADEFNVLIGLITILSWPTCTSTGAGQDCTSSYTIQQRLSDFSNWRASQDNSAGLWHLMSNCSTYPTIGIAWMNQLCVTSVFSQTDSSGAQQYVTGVGVSTPTATEHMVIAHEIGHNFGAAHDCIPNLCCNSDTCPKCCPCTSSLGTCDCKGYYIMHPTSDVNTINPSFSACSKKDMCSKNVAVANCLQTPGQRQVLNGNICGNGVREGNEECDCGGATLCANNTCCFANCTLKAGAVCSDGNNACCQDCQVVSAAANRTCRALAGECDVTEVCNGSKDCPTDTFQPDGLTCGNASALYCASGLCTNRANQCKAFTNLNFARTSSVNYVSDCSFMSGQCLLFCQDSFGVCSQLPGSFRDGTICGNDGRCYNGVCSNPDLLGQIVQWIMLNRNIAMVAGIVGGVILITFIYLCLKNVKTGRSSEQAKLDAAELARYEILMKKAKAARRSSQAQVGSGHHHQHSSGSDERGNIKSSAVIEGRRQSMAAEQLRRQSMAVEQPRRQSKSHDNQR